MSMRRSFGMMAALAAIAAAGANDPHSPLYSGNSRRPAEVKPSERYKALHKVSMVEHEFIIHGESIMARNRKTALKIYANRHKK